jgi:hypothetical protein
MMEVRSGFYCKLKRESTSPSGMTPSVRSAVDSKESNAKRPYESPTKNLVPSSFAGHHLDSIRRFVETEV